MQRHLYVFCYDVAHDKRRYRLARALEALGTRVQESVFECWLEQGEAAQAGKDLLKLLDRQEDLLTWYRMTHEEARATQVLGLGRSPSEPRTQFA